MCPPPRPLSSSGLSPSRPPASRRAVGGGGEQVRQQDCLPALYGCIVQTEWALLTQLPARVHQAIKRGGVKKKPSQASTLFESHKGSANHRAPWHVCVNGGAGPSDHLATNLEINNEA